MMKNIILFVLVVGALLGCSSNGKTVLQRSIGELIISHDTRYSYQEGSNPFGSTINFDEFVKIYRKDIEKLKVDLRIQYFWFGMWHLGFGGHNMYQFQELIIHDCGDEFIQRLDEYITTESELKRDKNRLYLSGKVLQGLKNLKLVKKLKSK